MEVVINALVNRHSRRLTLTERLICIGIIAILAATLLQSLMLVK